MGCNGSKSAGTENQKQTTEQKNDANTKGGEQQNGEKAQTEETQEQQGEKKDEVYVTKEEAEGFVMSELGVTEEKAKVIVSNINTNDDGKIANEEIKALWEKVKAKRDEVKPLFEKYDKDKSGFCSPDEAMAVMKEKFGANVKEENLKKMMGRWAKDDKINYNDFVLFYAMVCTKKESLEKMFDALDNDGDGFLSCKAVAKCVQGELGCTEGQALAVVEDFDQAEGKGDDGDGKISRDEFKKIFTQFFA